MEAPQNRERANGNNGMSSESPIEGSVWPGRILPGPPVMLHQETMVPGELIVCSEEAGMSLPGDYDACTVWRRYR